MRTIFTAALATFACLMYTEVTAIIPSFPYARQDKKSKSRDAITGLVKFINI